MTAQDAQDAFEESIYGIQEMLEVDLDRHLSYELKTKTTPNIRYD
ncbi:hypothetical protein [Paenibacillus athensensis]|nr:hypothetical protein [Paenibacillus athensensis]